MKRLCVFCGSSPGASGAYAQSARILGGLLAYRGITLIYGGASVGLMGVLADASLSSGGEVIGVIPESLVQREISHAGLSELHVVGSMHERKALMAELSEGFVALPGGTGTLEELAEMFTWAQLGEHEKPCGLLDTEGYYAPLLSMLDRMVTQGFLSQEHRSMLLNDDDAESLIQRMARHRPPRATK